MGLKAKKTLYNILTAIEIIFITIIAVFTIMNMVMLVQYKILGYSVPRIFGYSFINILSGSMEPTVSAGDLVICKAYDSYGEGDAVLFEDDNYLILHRIVGTDKKTGEFVTKGDANNTNDKGTIKAAAIHGKMKKVLPGWGGVLSYLSSSMGMVWTILASLFIYLALDTGRDLLQPENEEVEERIESLRRKISENPEVQEDFAEESESEEEKPQEEPDIPEQSTAVFSSDADTFSWEGNNNGSFFDEGDIPLRKEEIEEEPFAPLSDFAKIFEEEKNKSKDISGGGGD